MIRNVFRGQVRAFSTSMARCAPLCMRGVMKTLYVHRQTQHAHPRFENHRSSAYHKGFLPLAFVGAALLSDDKLSYRIKKLLEKDSDIRSAEESIELFHLILSAGDKEVSAAEGKDIVIFMGNTGAGKSTLINFLSGCHMKKGVGDEVVVDPDSIVKEMAPIGNAASSCTYLPQKVGGNEALTFYDMPGFADNRGVEVALANTIVLKKLAQKAKSVRFVLVAEESELQSKKGEAWRETVKLLGERFNKTVGRDKQSLVVVITKNKNPVEGIRENVTTFAEADLGSINLSKCVKTYNPLDPGHRDPLLLTISSLKSYAQFEGNISMSAAQITHAKKMGDKIADKIKEDLTRNNLQDAKSKLLFTRFIADQGNPDLKTPFETASGTIQKHIDGLITEMSGQTVPANRFHAFRDIIFLRKTFVGQVPFTELDKKLRQIISTTYDSRWLDYENDYTLAAILATIIIGYKTEPTSYPFLLAVALTILIGKRELHPNENQKLQDDFFSWV